MKRKRSGASRIADDVDHPPGSGGRLKARSNVRRPPSSEKVLAEGITFEELRRAKYDFALGDDARICKQLNDLTRLLRPDRSAESDRDREALALIEGPIMKIAGKRRKALRRVMEFVAAEIGRGRAEQAREVVDDLIGGIFRHSPEGIHSWGEYRRRFERLFPEVIRYREPLAIKLQDYNTLTVQFLRKGVEVYRLELEHEDYEKARVLFAILHKDLDVNGQFDWWTLRARTFTLLEHKSIRIELPARGDCRIEFLCRRGVECRLDYGPESGHGAAFYVADRKGRLVRVFSDEAHGP